jgi:TonB-linked SusC/RagA family outer membrane protein
MKQLIYLFAFLFAITVSAQEITWSGSINTATGSPLPGASITVQGTSIGAVSDFDGNFTITFESGSTLVFSYVGYTTYSVIAKASDSNVNILLKEDASQLDEVVVTGYGKERKKDITGAISVVDVEDMEGVATPNVISKLQSKIPGLTMKSSGVPGGNDTQISIRGLTSVFGGTGPLWVIDGVQTTSPAGLNASEIESIQVLKDAASAGIYGTEAARGVIVVTTKQAKEGAAKITLNTSTSVNTVRDNFSVLNAQQWLDVRYVAQGNVPVPAGNFVYTPGVQLPTYLDANNNLLVSDTNWINTILRNSVSTRTDFGYSKAKDNWKVYTGLGYANDNGIIEYTYYKRMNARLNSSVKLLNDKLTIGENLTVTNFKEVKGNSMEDALLQNPLIPMYGEDGTWGGPTGGGLQDKWNPLAILYINRNNVQETTRTFGNVYFDYNVNDKITVSSKFNFDINKFKFNEQTEAFNQNGSLLGNRYDLGDQVVSRYNRNRNLSETFILTNMVAYSDEIGKHSINAFAGHEMMKKDQNNVFYRIQAPYGEKVDFENVENYTILQDSSVLDAYGIGADSRRESAFAKVSYDYDDTYYLSVSARRDGSSRFGKNNRYATFPTASAGWTLSNEKFLKESNTVDNLKLRASWGGNGNADILEYAQYSIYNISLENSNYDLVGSGYGPIAGGVSPNQVGNPDLKWEQSYQTNLGLDAALFNSKLNVVVDVYKKETSDLLLQIIQPSVLGEAGKTLFFNAGDMENIGIDAVIGYKSIPTVNEFRWGTDVTFSAYRNKITQLNNSDNFILNGVSYTGVGESIGSYYGYIADGIFRTPEEVAVHAQQPGKALGNIRYRDINQDGVINQDDRTIIGNPHPDFTFGIGLNAGIKNWDLNVFFDGSYGNDMYNSQREMLDFPYFGFNHGLNTLDAWSTTNANSLVPALNTSNSNDQKRASTYFIEDGSFFRMRTLSISHDLTNALSDKLGLSSINVFAQAENLFTLTRFSGFDYEVPGLSRTGIGIAGLATYPHTKSFTLGLNLQF